ncbi:hydroxyacid dehydrogenase [Marnyiella aurantia]|uniref:Hydroxyacid dehydrogenase n=1 Tax=Marnyiella aurantia TaxID=2758037 RepID=A0A7D7QXA7_9FLAO|nr:NAD(P)-dependent oxidoreductase [Marnyiella aurantia]MBA5246932.1 hydroxyacid dehydrogenase [Marnyiella aurantia]QMS97726.1 hydroxyacid dehydrogenase [Marnyiella aurantia]
MRILQLDKNHPLIKQQLSEKGFVIDDDFSSTYAQLLDIIEPYEGIIIRSRVPMDRNFIQKAGNLKFIARVGAGLENIDLEAAAEFGVSVISSPEGNRDAVAEHVLGMLLVLTNRLFVSAEEVKQGLWRREENRGDELTGKTFGIIGYGNMGKAVARRLSGFSLNAIFYDIKPDLGDAFASAVNLDKLMGTADIISLHIPLTEETHYLVDEVFINGMAKDFYLINASRGKNVKTKALVRGLKSGKIIGAALDVLEFEKPSFEKLDSESDDLKYLLQSEKVIVTPHIAGWTHQSKEKLAQVIVDKIVAEFAS